MTCSVLAVAILYGATGCSAKSCNQVGCLPGVSIQAALVGPSPWRVSYCRGGTCTFCNVDNHPEGGNGATGCTDLGWLQGTGDAAPTLHIDTLDPTNYPEGILLSLSAQDSSRMRTLVWSAAVHYTEHEVDEGAGCEPARCSAFSVTAVLK